MSGVDIKTLSNLYPRLYHMAHRDSWKQILRLGLLSTTALLDRWEIKGKERFQIEQTLRKQSYEICHSLHGKAVIRDQKPIHESKLAKALTDCSPREWYLLLNSKVFFWLTIERLRTLLGAREYIGQTHLVLTLDTESLAMYYQHSITLCALNSGNTVPFAHPRGSHSFMKMTDYPFQERLKRGPYYTVVELAVQYGVCNVKDFILKAELMICDKEIFKSVETIFER